MHGAAESELEESDALIVKGQFMFVSAMPLLEPSCLAMAAW